MNLIHILRRANSHYSQLAASIRASLRPTHHARKRAQALRLTISIQAAANLDQKQISTIPLPILERVATPTPEPAPSPTRHIVAPVPRYASQAELNKRGNEVKRVGRPLITCTVPKKPVIAVLDTALSSASTYSTVSMTPNSAQAPAALRGLNVPWQAVTSRWSATTVGDDVVEDDITEEVMVEDSSVYSSDYDESMDLPASADSLDDVEDCPFESLRPRVAVTGSARARVSLPAHVQLRVPLPTRMSEFKHHARKLGSHPPRLDVPVDVARLSWGSDISSGSASSSSSNGPATPNESPKQIIRIKRKSPISHLDLEDDTALEKRPKYERKAWVTPATRRSTQRIAPSHRF